MDTSRQVDKTVIFFDGVCNLCNGAVDFIMKRDRNQEFKFASLQSDYAEEKLPSELTEKLASIVLYTSDGKIYQQSDAALRIAMKLNALWPVFGIFLILPRWLRDPIYDWIAKNRYKWFGKRDTCRLPTPEEAQRIIA